MIHIEKDLIANIVDLTYKWNHKIKYVIEFTTTVEKLNELLLIEMCDEIYPIDGKWIWYTCNVCNKIHIQISNNNNITESSNILFI